MSLLAGGVVKVETKWFPPLTFALDSSQQGDTFGGLVGGAAATVLKPKLTLSYQGATVYTAAPGGDPGVNQWNTVRWVLLGIIGFTVFKILF